MRIFIQDGVKGLRLNFFALVVCPKLPRKGQEGAKVR